jgi:DNA polymerase III subunit delta'
MIEPLSAKNCNFETSKQRANTMKFSDIIGQKAVKDRLVQSVKDGRVSHAQLFWGPPGIGKLALALAYGQFLNCTAPTPDDSCGTCPSCIKSARLTHPDLHFIYPTTTTKKVKKDPESKLFAEEWREFILNHKAYVDLNRWYDFLGVENKQGTIFARDASEIIRRLNFKAYEGKFKVMIIWMVEKLNITAANKLLKLLEEPPENTLFILIAEEPEQILTTIKSRTYQVKIPRIETDELTKALATFYDCRTAEVSDIAAVAHGNWLEALRLHDNAEEEKFHFHNFQQWMRLCFRKSVSELIDFCANINGIGRERQKAFLNYGLTLFRNALLSNNGLSELVRLTGDEHAFASKFAPFVHHANILEMVSLMEEGIQQIERNANAQILFMDTSLKVLKLLQVKP